MDPLGTIQITGTDLTEIGIHEELARAVAVGDTSAVALAIACGVNVNHVFDNGRSILMEAVMARRADICHLLLEAGANPDVADQWGETLMHRAAFSGNAAICEMLVARGADPLFVPEDVDAFVFANPEISSEIGYLTPLQKAVYGRKPEAIQYLFGVTGASPYQTTISGKSMEQLAGDHEASLKILRALKTEWDVRHAIDRQAVDAGAGGCRVRTFAAL